MTLEIERRFLVKNDKWKKFITKKINIEQGYLSKSLDDWIIRIRFTGQDFRIAIKKHIKSFTNFEFEYSIPRSDGEKIMSNLTNIIKKERYFLEIDQKTERGNFRGEIGHGGGGFCSEPPTDFFGLGVGWRCRCPSATMQRIHSHEMGP